jgi:hypothetical protein
MRVNLESQPDKLNGVKGKQHTTASAPAEHSSSHGPDHDEFKDTLEKHIPLRSGRNRSTALNIAKKTQKPSVKHRS